MYKVEDQKEKVSAETQSVGHDPESSSVKPLSVMPIVRICVGTRLHKTPGMCYRDSATDLSIVVPRIVVSCILDFFFFLLEP